MFVFRRDPDARLGVGVAFTSDRLDLGDRQSAGPRAAAYAQLAEGLGVPIAVVGQVHGRAVVEVGAEPAASGLVDLTTQQADALVTTEPGLGVAVRVADCVPICLATADGASVAAVHAGRNGLLEGVIAASAAALRRHSGADLLAWVGPHVCGSCYEVPAAMATDAADRLGVAPATTRWGTPAIDLTRATLAQLRDAGADTTIVEGCTLHGSGLHSHRGGSTGRQVGVAWLVDSSAALV